MRKLIFSKPAGLLVGIAVMAVFVAAGLVTYIERYAPQTSFRRGFLLYLAVFLGALLLGAILPTVAVFFRFFYLRVRK